MTNEGLATKFDSAQASPGFLLWQITNKWQARQRQALAAFGLTHVQFVLLASLVWNADKQLTQKQLAIFAKTDVMMTSQVIRRLLQKNLVSRTKNDHDSRSYVLRATPQGITLANRAVRSVEQVDADFFSPLGDQIVGFATKMQTLANQA